MKKLLLITTGLLTSLGAYAAVPTDAQPFQVVVPNLKSGLEITLEGLLLRPSNSDLDYTLVTATKTIISPLPPFVQQTTSQSLGTVNPDMNFGFRVGLGYVFADSGNDIQLNWTHFDHSDSDTTGTVPGQTLVTGLGVPLVNLNAPVTFFRRGIGLITIDQFADPTATSSVSSKLDALDLDVGQYLDIGTRLRARLFGGLRLARVESNQNNNYSAAYSVEIRRVEQPTINTVINYAESDSFNSKFTGIGPRFGLDSSYHLGNCFGVVGHVAGALLVGNVNSNTSQYVAISSTPTPGTLFTYQLNTNSSNVTRVVPALDAKLGLDYSAILANQSVLSLEAGYQWTQYIDAVDRFSNTLTGLGTTTRTTSSIGFDGPYLSVNWKV